LAFAIAGSAVLGIIDGSGWRSPLTATIAYRPAFLFGVALVFGWRGLACGQIVILAVFGAFSGWRTAIVLTSLFTTSHALGLLAARRLSGGYKGLSRERATLAFLAGAILAPAVPALLTSTALWFLGVRAAPGLPTVVDVWLRGVAGILAVVPVMLVYGSNPLRNWAGFPPDSEWRPLVTRQHLLELCAETAICGAILWMAAAGIRTRKGDEFRGVGPGHECRNGDNHVAATTLVGCFFSRGSAPSALQLLANNPGIRSGGG
jgi:hypothetical protein